jgi:hypothetical protein
LYVTWQQLRFSIKYPNYTYSVIFFKKRKAEAKNKKFFVHNDWSLLTGLRSAHARPSIWPPIDMSALTRPEHVMTRSIEEEIYRMLFTKFKIRLFGSTLPRKVFYEEEKEDLKGNQNSTQYGLLFCLLLRGNLTYFVYFSVSTDIRTLSMVEKTKV